MTVSQINQWLKAKSINIEAKSVKKINNSFTNNIYRILGTDGKLYKLRIANENPYINRALEYYIEMQLNKSSFLYYDKKNGNYLREWYVGKILKKRNWSQKLFDDLEIEIHKYQSLSVPKEINMLYPKYFDDVQEIKDNLNQEFQYYKNIIKTFNTKNLVISHNDFSAHNIIVDSEGIYHVYDYEWSTINHKLWDICNMIKDLEVSINQIAKISQIQANLREYVNIIFTVHFYTIFWTYRVKPTKQVLKYRKHMLKRLAYWFDQIKLLNPEQKKK